MTRTRLQPVNMTDSDIHVMIKAVSGSELNENEFYILEDSNSETIQKNKKAPSDPEFIVLLSEENVFWGLYKMTHVADNIENTAACWYKIY